MIRLAISVEGPTEKEFVKSILADHLRTMEVEPTPIVIGSRVKGGNVSVERLVSDMVHLHWSFDAVTSLVDFYRFRRKGERTVDELEEHLGQEIRRKVPDQKTVIPYVQKHEFEGLLILGCNVHLQSLRPRTRIEASASCKLQSRFVRNSPLLRISTTIVTRHRASALRESYRGTRRRLTAPWWQWKLAWRRFAPNAHGLANG